MYEYVDFPMRPDPKSGMIDTSGSQRSMKGPDMTRAIESTPYTLLVARSGRWRTGLRAMLEALPHFGIVLEVHDAPSALLTVSTCPPAIVVVDETLADDAASVVLRRVAVEWPEIRRILLVNGYPPCQSGNASAPVVLSRYCTLATLSQTVSGLFSSAKLDERS